MGLSQLGATSGGISTLDTNTPTSGLSGLLKSASNSLESAVAGTDYLEPSAIGTIASQAANSVSITGGSITGLSSLTATSGSVRITSGGSIAIAGTGTFECYSSHGGTRTWLVFDGGGSNASMQFGSNGSINFNTSSAAGGAGLNLRYGGSVGTLQLGTTHATTPTAQTIRAHGVTTGTGASLTLQGGSGSVARGNVALEGAYINLSPDEAVTAFKAFQCLDASNNPRFSANSSGIGFFGVSNALQVANIADASTSHSVSGSDSVSQSGIESALNDLGTKINSIISALETYGLTAS